MVVLSNPVHLAAATGRVIACPFIPGEIFSGAMAMIVTVQQAKGVVLPELVQWLPAEPSTNPSAISAADRSPTRPQTDTALIS